MVLQRNLEQLVLFNQPIHKYYQENSIEEHKELVNLDKAKNGQYIVKYKSDREICFNSIYNPGKEADVFMSDYFGVQEKSVLVMFGLSNCEYLRSFFKNRDNTNTMCIVYEPCKELFECMMSQMDLSDILENPCVRFVVKGINEEFLNVYLSLTIDVYNLKKMKTIVLPRYKEVFEEQLNLFYNTITEQAVRVMAWTNTVLQYGPKICENNIFNMRYFVGCRAGTDYENYFPEDMPVIIVAAGPSLEKNVNELNKAKGKALIVVVDTAIPVVLSHGIIPDMIISIDYDKPHKYFEYDVLKRVPFLADTDTSYTVLDLVKPETIIMAAADSPVVDNLFKKEKKIIQEIDCGGSVATTAIAIMISWGFKKIILTGQDLAIDGNKIHAGEEIGNVLERKCLYTYVDGICEEKVLTRDDFLIYLRWIEEIACRQDSVEIIDATEGGARKKNTKIMSLNEAIENYCTTQYDIEKMIIDVEPIFENSISILEALNEMKVNLRTLKKRAAEVISACKKAAFMLERKDFNVKELKKINASKEKLDEYYFNLPETIYINKYMAKADVDLIEALNVEENDDIKEAIRMYNESTAYYEKISGAIPNIIEIIDRCIDKVSNEVL